MLRLTGEEAKHLHAVLRAKVGDVFYAVDGGGKKYRAIVEEIAKSGIRGRITSITRLDNEPFYQITLAHGICRPNKMDEIVEKGTELGINSFIFYYSDKGYAKMLENSSPERKISRLNRIIRAAVKQSKRTVIPQVGEFVSLHEILRRKNDYDLSLFAIQHENARTLDCYLDRSRDIKRILLLVGPESGYSEDEEAACLGSGILPVSLGPRRLRTETAGIIFPALVLSYLGDL